MERDYSRQIHFETYVYWKFRQLPDHFVKASDHYDKMLEDNEWFLPREGKFVALMVFDDRQIIERMGDDRDELISSIYREFGYLPIFTTKVTREKQIAWLGPRAYR